MKYLMARREKQTLYTFSNSYPGDSLRHKNTMHLYLDPFSLFLLGFLSPAIPDCREREKIKCGDLKVATPKCTVN